MYTANLPKTQEPKLKKPSLYQIILLNDDYTPMDFVVLLLQKFFKMDLEFATKIMMKIHTEGQAVCGIYDKDIAETRNAMIKAFVRSHKHILKSIVEKVE